MNVTTKTEEILAQIEQLEEDLGRELSPRERRETLEIALAREFDRLNPQPAPKRVQLLNPNYTGRDRTAKRFSLCEIDDTYAEEEDECIE